MKNKMFVIQSLPRCGTHLLRTALDSHPDIDCLGDVFDPNSSGRHGFPKLRPTPAEVITYCSTQARLTGFVAHAHAGLAEDETGAGLDEAYRAQPEVRAGPGLWQAIPPERFKKFTSLGALLKFSNIASGSSLIAFNLKGMLEAQFSSAVVMTIS